MRVFKNIPLLILTTLGQQGLATPQRSPEAAAPEPQCTAVVQRRGQLVSPPQKLATYSLNRFGIEIDGYSFEVQESFGEYSLLIRDPKNNASYSTLTSDVPEGQQQKLRIQLEDTQLILSCR